MRLKRIFCAMLTLVLTAGCTFVISGCGKDADAEKETQATTEATVAATEKETEINKIPVNPLTKKDTDNKVGYQLDMPEAGEEIAIIHTNMGDITLRLFPENAPKTVENFVTLAREGKYDNTIFHRVINDFMIQGGDYEYGNGTGGKSIYGDKFEDEFCDTLYNIRGSVAMANSGVNTNGSQFFINQAGPDTFSMNNVMDFDEMCQNAVQQYNNYKANYGAEFESVYPTLDSFVKAVYEQNGWILSYAVTDEIESLYKANGGNMHLDGPLRAKGGHTVFAQVIEGMDVVDAIAAVKVDTNSKPESDVVINFVEITTY